MANNYSTKLTADTSQHDKALKKSANEIYKYSKSVDNAKKAIGTMAKKIPQIAAAVGVTTGAMATFKKLVEQTQSATDSWGRFTEQVNGALSTMANRLSGVGFGNFIDGLKTSARAAKEAYEALDQLGTMTIFQDKATADYNYKKAQYERIIKDKKSTKQQVKEAEAGLKKLREDYAKGQEALAAQAIKTYNAQMQQIFADAGVTVTEGFIKKYLGSLAGYEQASRDYSALAKKRNTPDRAKYYVDINTGQKVYTGGYEPLPNADDERRYHALFAVIQASDEKLKEANGHYINARNIQTAIIQDEIAQMKMTQAADKRVEKTEKTKEAEPEILSKLEELKKQEAQLKKDIEMLYTIDDNGAPVVLDPEKVDELNKKLKETQNQIELIEHAINPPVNTNFDIPSSGLYSTREEYDAFMAEVEKATQEAQSIIDSHFEDMYSNIKEISSSMNGLIGVFEEWQSLAENPNADFGDYFKTITSTIFTTIDAIVNIVTAIKTLSTISQAFKAAETLMDGVVRSAALAEMAAKVTAFYAELGPFGVAPAAATIAAYNALALPKFANGGVYEGATTVGDHGIARVNAGEMILNTRQQGNLFKLLDGVASLQPATSNGNVHFKIAGADLVGVLANYTDKKNRIM